MKKTQKKLSLSRETLSLLEESGLRKVDGGDGTYTWNNQVSVCRPCPTK
jgi:hypothetical protein